MFHEEVSLLPYISNQRLMEESTEYVREKNS